MLTPLILQVFPYVERIFRFLRTDSRQDYLLGTLTTSSDLLITHLRTHGFEDQVFAWVDDGQVASLRKRDGVFQYHVRIFYDGEVRGHYEYAPEDAPIKHLRRIAREARRVQFLSFIGEHIQPTLYRVTNYDTRSSVRQATLVSSYRT